MLAFFKDLVRRRIPPSLIFLSDIKSFWITPTFFRIFWIVAKNSSFITYDYDYTVFLWKKRVRVLMKLIASPFFITNDDFADFARRGRNQKIVLAATKKYKSASLRPRVLPPAFNRFSAWPQLMAWKSETSLQAGRSCIMSSKKNRDCNSLPGDCLKSKLVAGRYDLE